MNEKRTDISELGEFKLIDQITEKFKANNPKTIKAIGDDAAVIDCGDHYSLVSTDFLLEGVHFDLSYVPLSHLGYKAVVANVSDICAMNGLAEHITVSIAMSNRFSVEAIEELYSGIHKACEIYKLDLIGGDTSSSLSGLVISITVFGKVDKDKVVYRSGAGNKDLLLVSGDLGGAYMGLQILEREKMVFKEAPGAQPELEGFDYLLERQLKPEARVDVIRFLDGLGVIPTSMIDVSDGLASEIFHLSKSSNLGVRLIEEKIPMDKLVYETAREFNLDPTLCALSGGEDYELLFTVSQADYDKVKDDPNFSVIGHMTDIEDGNVLVDQHGGEHPLQAQGWNAFKSEE